MGRKENPPQGASKAAVYGDRARSPFRERGDQILEATTQRLRQSKQRMSEARESIKSKLMGVEELKSHAIQRIKSIEGKGKAVGQAVKEKVRRNRERMRGFRKQWSVLRPKPVRAVRALGYKFRSRTMRVSEKLGQLRSDHDLSRKASHTLNLCFFGLCTFVAGKWPQNFHYIFLAWFLLAMPARTVAYVRYRMHFFLIDFCYWVNASVWAYLAFYSHSQRLEAFNFAISAGPVLGAIILWRCSAVFGSLDHMISVQMHLLPAQAMFMHQHYRLPDCQGEVVSFLSCRSHADAWQQEPETLPRGEDLLGGRAAEGRAGGAVGALVQGAAEGLSGLWDPQQQAFWVVTAGLGGYLLWQKLYFVVVHLGCRQMLLRHKEYGTSYRSLAHRAAKANNWVNRTVRRGSPLRRVAMFGLLQTLYTAAMLALVLPLYRFYWPSLAWQLLNIYVALWNGSEYVYKVMPRMVEQKIEKTVMKKIMSASTLSELIEASEKKSLCKETLPEEHDSEPLIKSKDV